MNSPPTVRDQLIPAASLVATMLRGLDGHEVSRPTPCAEWNLGDLAQHAVGTTTGLATIGRKEELGPDPWAGPDVGADDWNTVLADRVEALAAAWDTEEAWTGSVQLGAEMPASTIGEMAFAEILLHGWDVARSTGADWEVDPQLATTLLHTVAETAELGRQMGAYGPAVEVARDASDLDRALGAAGRDPSWRPA